MTDRKEEKEEKGVKVSIEREGRECRECRILPFNPSHSLLDQNGKIQCFAFTWKDPEGVPEEGGQERKVQGLRDAKKVYPKMIFFSSERERQYVYDLCSRELKKQMLFIEYFPEKRQVEVTSAFPGGSVSLFPTKKEIDQPVPSSEAQVGGESQ